jgi:hypothetical protein
MANESTPNQLIGLLESVERRLLALPDAASPDTSVQSAADLARRLVEIAIELNKLPVPPMVFMPDSDAAPWNFPNSACRQRTLLQGLETNRALEFEPDDHNVGEVFRWDQNDANTTRRADALGILGSSSNDVSPRLEIPLLPREQSASSNGTILFHGPPLGYCARNIMRIFGTFLAVGLTLYAMNSLSYDSACGSRDLPAPVERYDRLWKCAAKLSGNDKLVQDSPQARAVEWFVTGTGRGIDAPSHCSWDTDFATLYALIVIRKTLAVQDASWHSSHSNININGNTEVESLQQVCRDWTRIQCNGRGQLSGLILADANLVGTLPAELSILQDLTTLQVHSNPGVTGSLPAELSRLTKLEVFMLQQTHLAGTVPSQWGRMTNLQQLLLDDTLLTGTVPIEICRLRKEHALDSLHANCRGDHALIQCSCCTLCK